MPTTSQPGLLTRASRRIRPSSRRFLSTAPTTINTMSSVWLASLKFSAPEVAKSAPLHQPPAPDWPSTTRPPQTSGRSDRRIAGRIVDRRRAAEFPSSLGRESEFRFRTNSREVSRRSSCRTDARRGIAALESASPRQHEELRRDVELRGVSVGIDHLDAEAGRRLPNASGMTAA